MSKVATGMNFKMAPDIVPMVYKKFPDGRSVIGLGSNATDDKFWEAAKNGDLHKLSFAELQDLYNRVPIPTPLMSLEMRWVTVGYAVSTEDDPETMVGVLQCYTGTSASMSGDAGMCTFNITISLDFGVDETFQMTPTEKDISGLEEREASKDEFKTKWDLNTQLGLEIYGGPGNSWVSAGVYGSGTLTMSLNMYPEGVLNSMSEDGETGIKVKFLGVTIYTLKLNEGHKDIYPTEGKNGEIVYEGNMNLKEAMQQAIKNGVENGYGDLLYKPTDPEGNQSWLGGTDLTDIDVDEMMVDDDSPYAKKIASNVFPESGIKVEKLTNGNEAVVVCISNNGLRPDGNKGELTWMKYDNEQKEISEPIPVCTDVDGDGRTDTGSDYDPKLRRNPENGKLYLIWKRSHDNLSSSFTVTDVAKDYRLCFAEFDEENNQWKDAKVILDDSNIVIGGAGIATRHPDTPAEEDEFVIYAFTNPEEDPAGLDTASEHTLMYIKRDGSGNWHHDNIHGVTGRITSFDGGYYYFNATTTEVAAKAFTYALEDEDGNSKVVVENDDYYHFNPVVFDGGKNAAFVEGVGNLITLSFTKDGGLYVATKNDASTRVFPSDESQKILEDPFNFIGNISNGTAIIGYLSSKRTSQNVTGYIRGRANDGWNFVRMTDVDWNTIINYFDGAIFDNGEPMIIYTAQKYTENSSGGETEFIDGASDMYIQAGEVNTHVSLTAAEITNLDDIGADDTKASVSASVCNNGLEPINTVKTYVRVKNSDEFVETGTFHFEGKDAIYPGQSRKVDFKFSGDFAEPTKYVAAVVGSSDSYERTDIQSTKLIDVPEGRARVTRADYRYRNLKHDVCSVTVTSKGPGEKSGKYVFYNSETKEIYQEVPFTDLGPGETSTYELMNPDGALVDAYPNLRVKVLMDDETLDGAKAQIDDTSVFELPAWYIDPYLDDLTPAQVVKAPTANDCYANGKEQPLLKDDAIVDGGTLQYALGGKEKGLYQYSDKIPTQAEPGIYYVWVKAVGDNSHTDSQPFRTKTKIVYPVTFKVVGGKWDDGTSADKRVDLSRYDDEDLALVLKPEDIPGVGNKPNEGYLKEGSWDVEPPLDTLISEAKTYTYTYKTDPNYKPPEKVTKPGKTKVKQAIKKKKSPKKISIKLKKVKGAKGYQVAVYKSKKYAKKNKKAIKKKYSKKVKFTVKSKKFKKYKKLYVKARAYKLDGKKKVFGKWSKVKKVKKK